MDDKEGALHPVPLASEVPEPARIFCPVSLHVGKVANICDAVLVRFGRPWFCLICTTLTNHPQPTVRVRPDVEDSSG